jgi:SAM-dependent methyltransferase
MQQTCLACGGHIHYPLYNPPLQPMGMIDLPRTVEDARNVPRYPLNFRLCALCSHVFNVEFDYTKIPYASNTNLMYNRGATWQRHMERMVDVLVERFGAKGKTVVDIGCGDGLFLGLLLKRGLGCRCIGFEPGIEAINAQRLGLTVYRDYFEPQRDLKRIRPDILVCRHVIEHLEAPRKFLSGILYWSNQLGLAPVFMAEVPRIDKALSQGRRTDFLYEHVSHFTERSFRTLWEGCGYEVLELLSCYEDEVSVAVCRPKELVLLHAIESLADGFRRRIDIQNSQVRSQLDELLARGRSVAFWGAASKGAAFLNAFEATADRFPVVVDSDQNKVGGFVPGTSQEIRSPDYLRDHPVDVIVITTRWRARDIAEEIARRGIVCDAILVLEGERLQPYAGDEICPRENIARIESEHPNVLPPISLSAHLQNERQPTS